MLSECSLSQSQKVKNGATFYKGKNQECFTMCPLERKSAVRLLRFSPAFEGPLEGLECLYNHSVVLDSKVTPFATKKEVIQDGSWCE